MCPGEVTTPASTITDAPAEQQGSDSVFLYYVYIFFYDPLSLAFFLFFK